MDKPFRISATMLFVAVIFLVVGELASGTDPEFVMMMAGTMLCIAVTFNFLGGIRTISGVGFTLFALCTIVISQFAKVFFFEAADKNLEAPNLTIKVYLVFFFCVMMGSFVYGRLRVRLPKPMESNSDSQLGLQYAISFIVGFAANAIFEYSDSAAKAGGGSTEAHSVSLAFSALLLFSLVLAVTIRLRETGGRHSFGVKAFLPWISIVMFGAIRTSRGPMLMPGIVWAITCYSNGYRFRRKHYLVGAVGLILFMAFVSPFAIFIRGYIENEDFKGRVAGIIDMIRSKPSWDTIRQASQGGVESGSREEYFDRPGTFILSRLSAIRVDSNMISATSTGFHYGFTALKIDALHSIPHFLYKNKPEEDSDWYLGRVTGLNPDSVENVELVITAISDSYGAFGWLGVIVVGSLAFPCCFVLYESLFDIRKPWGVVALGGFAFSFAEISMGGLLQLLTRLPIAIVALSYVVGGLVSMIPVRGAQGIKMSGISPAEIPR